MTFGALLSFCRPHRTALLLSGALMLGESLAALAIPWLGGRLADGLLDAGDIATEAIVATVLALLVLQAALRIAQGTILAHTSQALLSRMRTTTYTHLMSLPLSVTDRYRRGDLLTLISYETTNLSNFVTGTLVGLLPRLLTLVGALVLMLRIDAVLALPVAVCVPAFFLAMKLASRRMRPLSHQMHEAFARSVAHAEEGLALLPALKSFTRETEHAARHAERVQHTGALFTRMARYQAVLAPLTQLVAASALVLVLVLAGEAVTTGDMSPGELVAFLLYAGLLTRPIGALADTWGRVQQLRGTLARLSALMAEPPEDHEGGVSPADLRGEIVFEDLHFAHPGRPTCLHGVTLRIAAGETLALTGPNGAGKTTLVDLLLRFYTPDAGRILLDGADISTLNLRWLRSRIGVVPQKPLLLDASLRDNILMGKPDADDAALHEAVSLAQCRDVIETLPDGLDTMIGEKGHRLSGGQQQRVALARALIKEPDILIFDEPTAMFDPAGERALVAGLTEALTSCTVILITHRPESLALADRIVTLDAGRITEGVA